jgi:periplasmic divalent cation tolerance protein
MILVYITNPTKKVAQKIAKILLKKRLIACANIFEIESFYWWTPTHPPPSRLRRGPKKIERAKEFVLIGKTIEKNYKKIKKEVEKIHPYEIPCVLKIKAEANEKYLNWLEGEIKIKRNE